MGDDGENGGLGKVERGRGGRGEESVTTVQ